LSGAKGFGELNLLILLISRGTVNHHWLARGVCISEVSNRLFW
jgi:hypothetical protein